MTNISKNSTTNPELLHELNAAAKEFTQAKIQVYVDENSVTLSKINSDITPLRLSFSDRKTQNRLLTIKANQPLIKALNIKKQSLRSEVEIIDLTAGLGQDSLLLASLGYPLTSIEINPMTAAILKTLVMQYRQFTTVDWTVIQACSLNWLHTQKKPCATHIYMDPFFYKKKTAKPKKSMQWLHMLSCDQPEHQNDDLLVAAMDYATDRVIVKRDKNADYMRQKKPNQGSIYQKTSRLDCYKPYHK